jgi:beta-1,4-mannosyl-glycoprotein beta-1,4-N-acetylglucosaminyltransferase
MLETKKQKRKVIDCFLYNGENDLLSLKLAVTSRVVDYYIVIEGKFSFKGTERDMLFDINKFIEYKDKIVYVPFYTFPKLGANMTEKDYWNNENIMRNSALNVLKNIALPDDIIIISDIDEIINPSALSLFDP